MDNRNQTTFLGNLSPGKSCNFIPSNQQSAKSVHLRGSKSPRLKGEGSCSTKHIRKSKSIKTFTSVAQHQSYLESLSLDYCMRVFHQELRVFARQQVTPNHKPPKRMKGDISTFSKKSRRRMIRMCNRVRWFNLSESIFITLTCRKEALSPEDLHYKFHKIFLPALKIKIPSITGIWRMEAHKSGFPHFHIIAASKKKGKKMHSEYWKRKIRALWRDVIGQRDAASQRYAATIQNLEEPDQAMRYVSKYMAKETETDYLCITGRRWGYFNSIPMDAITEVEINYDEYLVVCKLVRRLLEAKGKPKGLIDAILSDPTNLFCWLNLGEMAEILTAIEKHTAAQHIFDYLALRDG